MAVSVEGVAKLKLWKNNPAQFVRDVFKVEPDRWQLRVLEAFPRNQRMAMKACKGPGKTCLLAWLAWNFLVTRPYPKVAAVSITEKNLADNLWTEMAKWQGKSELLLTMFEWNKSRITHRAYPETWWMSARSFPKNGSSTDQSDALAGLHSDYIMFLLDESGGMPDAVMATAEAALSSCIEGHIVQAGNPTHTKGPLYRACTVEAKLWHVTEITSDPDDPDRTPRVSIEWSQQQIDKYGRDNPWVLVNVFGKFPPSSFDTLLGPDDVVAAMGRHYTEYDIGGSARVLGVDVARFGDDASVIFPRQGLVAFIPTIYRNLNSTQGAGVVARKWQDWDADAAFVDDTGGYGAGWIDQLRNLGRAPIGVPFSGKPNDPRYFNKRTEMYFLAAQWIKEGGQLPGQAVEGMSELLAAMTTTTYSFRGDKLLLEPKEMVKERMGGSPDVADAFCLSFAQTVLPRGRRTSRPKSVTADWDMVAAMDQMAFGGRGVAQAEYDPFG